MEILNLDILKILADGGISLLVFIIWFFTFKEMTKQSRQNSQHIERLYHLVEQDAKYKEILTGILTKLEKEIINFTVQNRNSKNSVKSTRNKNV